MEEMNRMAAAPSGPSTADPGQRAAAEAQAALDQLIESLSADGVRMTEEGDTVPLYLVLSSRTRLTRKYGQPAFDRLDEDLRTFKRTVEGRSGIAVLLLYVDDGPSLSPYRLEPVDPTNPWQVKMLVDNLDAHLREGGQSVEYLLIVGGDGIIPFHRLPNPIDDQDAHVPSDNPYASRDANYFIPERAVGRMPDSGGEGIRFLRTLVRAATEEHRDASAGKGVLDTLSQVLRPEPSPPFNGNGHSLGYSASIWRKASRDVFRVIGEDRHLRISPPLTYREFQVAGPLHFSYFNLHGIEDGPNWYGQRDSLFPAAYPLFPVALRPEDLTAAEYCRSIIFTEACYGAHILGKTTYTSLALRFLAVRALALVGSTKIAYGAIAPPLLGADLIGRYFWEGLQAHLTVGEALKVAKINLAKRMYDRQGYLDGEDQKTLISFLLYGDPSLPPAAFRRAATMGKGLSAALCPPLLCPRRAQRQKALVSDELVATIKGRVEANLPHMAQARVRAHPLAFCSGDCGQECGHAPRGAKGTDHRVGSWSFTLEKDIPIEGNEAHRQVVQVTVDERGHILKLAVSK